MTFQDLIFSDKKNHRILRHLSFWVTWWLYFGFVHAVDPMGKPRVDVFGNLPYSSLESLLMIIPHAVFAYPLIYFVLPRFVFPGKYLKAILWSIVFMILSFFVNATMMLYVNPWILSSLLPDIFLEYIHRKSSQKFYVAFLSSLKGGLTGCALAVCIKMLKHYFLKERRNLQLLKENTEAQLQLLKAQVHPHFLFNTLNNIYSHAQYESPGSATMIIELSNILRYVLDEGKKELVPLENELQMITDYTNLEKRRYDAKLDMYLSLPEADDTHNLFIAPLTLLPFVENCFKHGTSKMLNNPWINLKIKTDDNCLHMKLMNGKSKTAEPASERIGTGIENVRKRLNLIYQNKHQLEIQEDGEVFIVNLKLELLYKDLPVTTIQSPTSTKEYAGRK